MFSTSKYPEKPTYILFTFENRSTDCRQIEEVFVHPRELLQNLLSKTQRWLQTHDNFTSALFSTTWRCYSNALCFEIPMAASTGLPISVTGLIRTFMLSQSTQKRGDLIFEVAWEACDTVRCCSDKKEGCKHIILVGVDQNDVEHVVPSRNLHMMSLIDVELSSLFIQTAIIECQKYCTGLIRIY